MYRGHNNKMIYVDHMGPHLVESFMDFFKNIFYAWLKLFGEDEKKKIPLEYMYMCMKIQNPHTYLEFDFSIKIEKKIHNQLVRQKTSMSFNNYSLLCLQGLY